MTSGAQLLVTFDDVLEVLTTVAYPGFVPVTVTVIRAPIALEGMISVDFLAPGITFPFACH